MLPVIHVSHDIAPKSQTFAETMRGIQGALIFGSSLQMIIGFLGLWRNIVRCVYA